MSHPIQRLIFQEARLLDEGKLDDWLALYTEDATYWVPIEEDADPLRDSSVIYDNRLRLAMRVEQIMRQSRVAQSPASNTLRMISNMEVAETGDDTATATFALLLTEVRSGDWRQNGLGETRLFPAHCAMTCKKTGDGWKIQHKKIVLLHRRQPIVGLSFII
ncbi:MAG: aromatic-ring-hydroxylating dioxygenase subunit beta [Pigmentiphaga sp.]|uniref:aromatic-ring-hydroxylating dioxygenase subunit beta n=1 Tax=Pigmentiphaga sp. TaxID=1977564 RepID=UPI0029AA8C1E|nr:aromatic-ring-hydroxylating dioxygenase subunit beta [Pigmentiphaga sp.]MDX3906352.1 aromatic-ring-hydroxylating dioxygenase subunit beta [Pigmentiphaga sp.]